MNTTHSKPEQEPARAFAADIPNQKEEERENNNLPERETPNIHKHEITDQLNENKNWDNNSYPLQEINNSPKE